MRGVSPQYAGKHANAIVEVVLGLQDPAREIVAVAHYRGACMGMHAMLPKAARERRIGHSKQHTEHKNKGRARHLEFYEKI